MEMGICGEVKMKMMMKKHTETMTVNKKEMEGRKEKSERMKGQLNEGTIEEHPEVHMRVQGSWRTMIAIWW